MQDIDELLDLLNDPSYRGQKGDRGISVVTAYIDQDGHLILELSNDDVIDVGKVQGQRGAPGIDGKDGIDGAHGVDGVSIEDVFIDNASLKIKLSSGLVKDLGNIKGEKGDKGDRGKEGKSAYQLWLDQGNKGSVKKFIESLRGEKGDSTIVQTGVVGSGLPIGGSRNNVLVRNDVGLAGSAKWTGNLNVDSIISNSLDVGYIDFDTTWSDTLQEGRLAWNSDDGTLELGMPGGNVNLQIGQEQLLKVKNASGGDILNGSVVYISGASGGNPQIDLADADIEATANSVVGLTTEDITNNQHGYVTTFGLVRGLDTSAIFEGSIAYLSQTAGEFTGISPLPPVHSVRIGYVVRQHATEGIIFVHVDTGEDLDQLHDVDITSIADKNVIKYDSVTQTWKNGYVADSEVTFTDITTNNASTSAHGYLPKLSGSSTQYLDGTGVFSIPSGIVNSYTSQGFTSQTSVTVTHNFSVYPIVQVVDSSGFVQVPKDIEHTSTNAFTVTFTSSSTGTIIASVGSAGLPTVTTTSVNYTTLATDKYIKAITAGITITLVSSPSIGFEQEIKNASSGSVVVSSSDTIDGSTTALVSPSDNLALYYDGTQWTIR